MPLANCRLWNVLTEFKITFSYRVLYFWVKLWQSLFLWVIKWVTLKKKKTEIPRVRLLEGTLHRTKDKSVSNYVPKEQSVSALQDNGLAGL